MKKSIVALCLVALAVLAVAPTAQAAVNYEQLAIQAALQSGCIADRKDIVVQVETVSICFVTGAITKATVIHVPNSNCKDTPNRPCPKPAATIEAEVMFGCSDEVSSVVCF